MSDLMKVGSDFGGAGTFKPFTSGVSGAQRVSDAHARFMESVISGRVFSGGMTATSIANATFTTATLGATATPIIGVWNPMNSAKNLVIWQVRVQVIVTASTATGGGALMWCSSVNQAAIATGITPLNRLSLSNSGAVGKVYANTVLTGLSGNMVVQEASGLSGGVIGSFSMVGTAAGFVTPPGGSNIDHIDGAFVVPPGGVLALLCTTTPVALAAASSILWEEVPVLPQV